MRKKFSRTQLLCSNATDHTFRLGGYTTAIGSLGLSCPYHACRNQIVQSLTPSSSPDLQFELAPPKNLLKGCLKRVVPMDITNEM